MKFDGTAIPHYWQAVDMAIDLHSKAFYGLYSIGWDIAFSPEGPVIIEGNENWGVDVLQLTNGGVKYLFDDYIDPVLKKHGKRAKKI